MHSITLKMTVYFHLLKITRKGYTSYEANWEGFKIRTTIALMTAKDYTIHVSLVCCSVYLE